MEKQFSMSMYVNRDDMYKDMMEYIRELEGRNQWVSVKERLPDVIGNYLIYGGENMHYTAWAFFSSEKEWVDFNRTSFYEFVTHWMPLPSPPEEEK